MNLHAIANSVIAAVNPNIAVTLKQSTGYTTGPGAKRIPAYAAPVTVQAQVQALSGKDLRQIDGLNLQGTLAAIYLYGAVAGAVRGTGQGGDLIVVPSGAYAGTWLVTMVAEQWGDGVPAAWCKVIVTLQDGA